MGYLSDVPGIRVGHAQRVGDGWLTGVTAVLPPEGTLGAVDVRGGGACTLQTDALRAGAVAPYPAAVALTGGSGYGLFAAAGVHRWCAEHGRGFPVGPAPHQIVPIVPAAAIYDLGRGGRFDAVPDDELGYRAALAAAGPEGLGALRGTVGAGTGAAVVDERFKGGVGGASATVGLPDGATATVAALAVVNAFGVPLGDGRMPAVGGYPDRGEAGPPPLNTTLVVVATDAALDRAQLERTATVSHDGLARAIDPVHTLADGDTVFALSTRATPLPPERGGLAGVRLWRDSVLAVHAAAARVVRAAVVDALLAATPVTTPAVRLPVYDWPGGIGRDVPRTT